MEGWMKGKKERAIDTGWMGVGCDNDFEIVLGRRRIQNEVLCPRFIKGVTWVQFTKIMQM
jgi:hypothetical protein